MLAARAGGFVALIGDLAARAGLRATAEPQADDIGIIMALTSAHGVQPVGAIHTGHGWVFLTPQGLGRAQVPHVAAWSIRP